MALAVGLQQLHDRSQKGTAPRVSDGAKGRARPFASDTEAAGNSEACGIGTHEVGADDPLTNHGAGARRGPAAEVVQEQFGHADEEFNCTP